MGKKARKTRWRALTIDDNEYSDSEESSTTTTQGLPKGYQPKSYYNKFSYSSQSTPRRRYQYDSTKSTRSSSTASETKITFNEDEYTKITTPRQDVLFKKGYLNKPKNYQTQTSTGTSTTSTGNSTGNGTPDHQSTDLDYESQFVFPNGFVDQNGIYYVNSYEPYPLMLYNPPTYYPEFSNCKSKRYSTGSLTESMSPNNEEATSQDLSGGEASNNVSDYSGHHHVYNMVYPGYYVNGVCPVQDGLNGQSQTDQTRRIKKRRRRKSSKSQTAQDSSECTEDETEEGNLDNSPNLPATLTNCSNENANCEQTAETVKEDINTSMENKVTIEKEKQEEENNEEKSEIETEKVQFKHEDNASEENKVDVDKVQEKHTSPDVPNTNELPVKSVEENSTTEIQESVTEVIENTCVEEQLQNPSAEQLPVTPQKSELKPDAEEFIPRAYRNSEIPLNPNLQFIKVPPNFIPIPIMPIGDFNGQNYNPAFIPPGIPINFLPPDPKMYPNFVGFVPNTHYVSRAESTDAENQPSNEETNTDKTEEVATCDNSSTAKEEKKDRIEKVTEKTSVQTVNSNRTIDIATIVSKLEEAAKEQDVKDVQGQSQESEEVQNSPRRRFADKNNRFSPKRKNIPNFRRSNYNNAPQSSSHSNTYTSREKSSAANCETPVETKYTENEVQPSTNSRTPECNGVSTFENKTPEQYYQKRNPEYRKHWKYQNGSPKWQPNTPTRGYSGKLMTENSYKSNQHDRNYSVMLKNKPVIQSNEQEHYENYASEKPKNHTVRNEQVMKVSTPQSKQSNQWISVSSRKKRKGKVADETEESFEEKRDHSENDQFEKYDVEQLVDVIPPSQEEEIIKIETATTEEIEIVDIINNIAQSEASLINNMENISLNVAIRSVDDIEKELIDRNSVEKDIIVIPKEAEEIINEKSSDTEINDNTTEQEVIKLTDLTESKPKSNKKSKKGTQKPITKRVIITDVDLSMESMELKAPLKKIVTKLIEKPSEIIKNEPIEIEEEKPVDLPKRDDEEEKKKNKKKKKKNKTTTINNSLSSSNTTINNMDDSYDFLLDSALSHESVDKTNVEVSHELDKIIQKGMYSSLEGKIKSLNIDDSDGFFKSVFNNISSTKSSTDKNGFNNTLDLSKILQDSRSLFRPSSVSQENNSQNKDINEILPDLDSTAEDGIFLENPQQTDIPQAQIVTNDKQNEETLYDHITGHYENGDETTKDDIKVEPKTLYPITEAVKEWMSKTRETTPDIEILKSPHEIYEEFCDSASETDTVVSDFTTDEEVTIFIKETELDTEKTSSQHDLMEYWENDLGVCENRNQLSEYEKSVLMEKIYDKDIEQGEDVLETYDSKYGKNEDYLNLQKEVKEKVNNSSHAKHGNLPYRAICCNIM